MHFMAASKFSNNFQREDNMGGWKWERQGMCQYYLSSIDPSVGTGFVQVAGRLCFIASSLQGDLILHLPGKHPNYQTLRFYFLPAFLDRSPSFGLKYALTQGWEFIDWWLSFRFYFIQCCFSEYWVSPVESRTNGNENDWQNCMQPTHEDDREWEM